MMEGTHGDGHPQVVEDERGENKPKISDFVSVVGSPDQIPDKMIKIGNIVEGCGEVGQMTADELWQYIQGCIDKPYFKDSYHGNIQLFEYILTGQLKMIVLDDKPVGFVMTGEELSREVFDPVPVWQKRVDEVKQQRSLAEEADLDERDIVRQEFLDLLQKRFSSLGLQFVTRNTGKKGFQLSISHNIGNGLEKLGSCRIRYAKIDIGLSQVERIVSQVYDLE